MAAQIISFIRDTHTNAQLSFQWIVICSFFFIFAFLLLITIKPPKLERIVLEAAFSYGKLWSRVQTQYIHQYNIHTLSIWGAEVSIHLLSSWLNEKVKKREKEKVKSYWFGICVWCKNDKWLGFRHQRCMWFLNRGRNFSRQQRRCHFITSDLKFDLSVIFFTVKWKILQYASTTTSHTTQLETFT